MQQYRSFNPSAHDERCSDCPGRYRCGGVMCDECPHGAEQQAVPELPEPKRKLRVDMVIQASGPVADYAFQQVIWSIEKFVRETYSDLTVTHAEWKDFRE